MNKLFFPQGTLSIEDNKPVQEIAFSICGGRKPAAAWLNMTVEKLPGTPEFFAADKGLDYYHAARFYPDKVIGDGDSADSFLWQQTVENGKAEVFPADKNETDLQLLLEILPPEKLWIFSGVYGGQKNRTIVLADEREITVFVPAGVKIKFYPPAEETPVAVSLLAFTEKSKVSVSGTKWQLDETELSRNNPFAISNEMSEAEQMKELPHITFSCLAGMTVFYVAG